MLGLVLCNFQKQELVIPVSLCVANVPSCPTLGSYRYMPVGELDFEILFCVKEREQSAINLGILHLKHFPPCLREQFVGADCYSKG